MNKGAHQRRSRHSQRLRGGGLESIQDVGTTTTSRPLHTGDALAFILNRANELPLKCMAIRPLNSGRIRIRLQCGYPCRATHYRVHGFKLTDHFDVGHVGLLVQKDVVHEQQFGRHSCEFTVTLQRPRQVTGFFPLRRILPFLAGRFLTYAGIFSRTFWRSASFAFGQSRRFSVERTERGVFENGENFLVPDWFVCPVRFCAGEDDRLNVNLNQWWQKRMDWCRTMTDLPIDPVLQQATLHKLRQAVQPSISEPSLQGCSIGEKMEQQILPCISKPPLTCHCICPPPNGMAYGEGLEMHGGFGKIC